MDILDGQGLDFFYPRKIMYAQMNSSPRAHVFKPSVHGSHPCFGHACVILCL